MRILHLSWEYPPVIYGGLGRHVHALAHAQAANGHDVVVITQAYGHDAENVALGAGLETGAVAAGGVRVVRTGGTPVEQGPVRPPSTGSGRCRRPSPSPARR